MKIFLVHASNGLAGLRQQVKSSGVMKCAEVQDRLSAYLDGELASDLRQETAQHLDRCSECANRLANLVSDRGMFAQIPKLSPPPRIWEAIVAELDRSQSAEQGGAVAAAAPTIRLGQTWFRIALAASILLLVGTGLWWARPTSTAHDHASNHGSEFVTIMDRYLRTLDSDPEAAERFLREQYQGKEVSPEQAVKLVGFQPAIASGIPAEYRLASTSVLTMPCCTCVKTVCKRQDGSTLVLFEHDDDAMQWFGSRPTRMATCGEHECCLVDLSENIAATWKHGSRWLTAIGLQDSAEAGRLADWLAEKVSADVKSLDDGLNSNG